MQVICSLFNREVATPSTRLYPQGNTTTATPVSAAKPKFRKDFHKHHFLAQHASQQSGTPGRPLHNLLVSVSASTQTVYLQWRFTISLKPSIANSRITEPNIFEHSVCPCRVQHLLKREKSHTIQIAGLLHLDPNSQSTHHGCSARMAAKTLKYCGKSWTKTSDQG